MPRTFDVESFLDPHNIATMIANKWSSWKSARSSWEDEKTELLQYIFATDTRKTSNKKNGWQNSTVTPKLCQIRDNLHANYMAALFPNDEWLVWEAHDQDSATETKRKLVTAFMRSKVSEQEFQDVTSSLLYDYIDFGNVFVGSYYENVVKLDDDGEVIFSSTKPKAYRINPLDHVFDVTAVSYEAAPKITRSLKTLGDLLKDNEERPNLSYDDAVINKLLDRRAAFGSLGSKDKSAFSSLQVDGFGSWNEYFTSEYVELLEFEGDIFDTTTNTLHKDRIITIVDRSWVLRNVPNPSWTGTCNKKHVGWRKRNNNLMAMGPLDNLVGMQYRIDHLENLKADAFDMIAFPMIKVKGYGVQDFNYVPGEKVFTGEDGDVDFMHPDVTFLQADTQISFYEGRMEEFAGAPKNQMGIRTPGEKTKFEVQLLDNAAKGIFQVKIEQFETHILEPLVNDMFEAAVRNMGLTEMVELTDESTGAQVFKEITKEDVTAKGKFKPKGASYFLDHATKLQELVTFAGSAIGQDPSVKVHFSGYKLAKVVEQLLGLEDLALVQENVSIYEQGNTQRAAMNVEQIVNEETSIDPNDPNRDLPADEAALAAQAQPEGGINSVI